MPSGPAEFVSIPKTSGAAEGGSRFLRPPHGTIGSEAAYKLTTVVGETFWLVLPKELSGGDVFVSPSASIFVHGAISPRIGLTAATLQEVAQRYCGGVQGCRPEAIAHESLANGGQLTRWTDAGGANRIFELTTVRFGDWTLSLSEGSAALAEEIARGLTWHEDREGFIQLTSSNPRVSVNRDWAEMYAYVRDPVRRDYNVLEILPGCRLAEKQPDLGGSNAGPTLELHEPDVVSGGKWCDNGRFWIDASWADGQRLRELYEKVRVVNAG
jgi:hypothetical protein